MKSFIKVKFRRLLVVIGHCWSRIDYKIRKPCSTRFLRSRILSTNLSWVNCILLSTLCYPWEMKNNFSSEHTLSIISLSNYFSANSILSKHILAIFFFHFVWSIFTFFVQQQDCRAHLMTLFIFHLAIYTTEVRW